MKFNLSIIVIFVLYFETSTMRLKADIPNICPYTVRSDMKSKGRTTDISKSIDNNSTSLKLEKNSTNSSTTQNSTDSNTQGFFPKIFLFLFGIVGIYLFGYILYLIKLTEEIYKSVKEHIDTRFSSFQELSFREACEMTEEDLENKHVFMKGLIFRIKHADDTLFPLKDDKNTYMKIFRKVEIYDESSCEWIDNYEGAKVILNKYFNDFDCNILNKLFSNQICYGQANLHCFYLKEEYFYDFNNYEIIDLNCLDAFDCLSKYPILKEILDSSKQKLEISYSSGCPILIKNDKTNIIRITLLGVRIFY